MITWERPKNCYLHRLSVPITLSFLNSPSLLSPLADIPSSQCRGQGARGFPRSFSPRAIATPAAPSFPHAISHVLPLPASALCSQCAAGAPSPSRLPTRPWSWAWPQTPVRRIGIELLDVAAFFHPPASFLRPDTRTPIRLSLYDAAYSCNPVPINLHWHRMSSITDRPCLHPRHVSFRLREVHLHAPHDQHLRLPTQAPRRSVSG